MNALSVKYLWSRSFFLEQSTPRIPSLIQNQT